MPDPLFAAIAKAAARQLGFVTRQQVLGQGVGRGTLEGWIAKGHLIPIHRGVYAVGHIPPDALALAYASVLACGTQAVAGGGTARDVWAWVRARWTKPFEVIVPADRRPAGIRVHRVELAKRDRTVHRGVPVTSPARTILDCAATISGHPLWRLTAQARLAGDLFIADLREVAARNPRHLGTKAVNAMLGEAQPNPERSRWEKKFPGWCRRHGLPKPLTNHDLHGFEADVYFEAERVVVELDDYHTHQDRDAFEHDREKDAVYALNGIVVVRITDERYKRRPQAEADRLRAILDARRTADPTLTVLSNSGAKVPARAHRDPMRPAN